ncbi:hypothetical protein MRB53_039267 [Persea americana]|nr:hypothetical protein MRB53_039267 [Persea americana]
MSMEGAVKTFFSAQRFAVAGASSDPRKFGHKAKLTRPVLQWYLSRSLTAVPLNPSNNYIDVPPHTAIATLPSPKALGDKGPTTSLSVITPPKVTRKLLEEAKEVGVLAVWLQPGTFDEGVLEFARREWPGRCIAGMEGGTRGGEGWCVLVDGDWGLGLGSRL